MTSTNSLTLGSVPDALASRRSEPAQARRHRPQFVLWIVVLVCAVYFIFPIWATAKFTLDIPLQGWTFSAYRQAINEPQLHTTLWLSVRIAAGTVALSFLIMVWTVMWSSLKVKRAQSAVEFTSIVPYMVPPIAFVTGIGGAFRGIFPNFIGNPLCLIPFYTVLAMPFTYRSLDAGLRSIDVKTLTEASRGLGAGWGRTIFKIIIPNIRAALLGAAFLTVAVVLGEFTIASLLLFQTFPTFLFVYNGNEIFAGQALGLMTILGVSVLFALLALLTRKRGGNAATAAIA